MKQELIPLEDAVHFQIYRLSLLLSRELKKALRPYSLTPERWQLLAALWESPKGLNQSRLGDITLKDKPSISRLVESMVEDGWLIRSHDGEDSRAYVVRTSAKANSSKNKILHSLYSHFASFSGEFGEAAQNELMRLVKAYIGIFEKLSAP